MHSYFYFESDNKKTFTNRLYCLMTFLASASLQITQNSLHLLRNKSFPIMITSSSMEFGVRQFRWHEQFHTIPWTCGAPISLTWAVPWNSMEFHGTWSAPITLTRAVPWNSMEFIVTWGAPISMTWAVPWNSMEFHGTWGAPIAMTRARNLEQLNL